jgi:SAM-dependent methyltransferase
VRHEDREDHPQHPERLAEPERLAFSRATPGRAVQAICRDLWASGINLNIHADDKMLAFVMFSQGFSLERAAAMYLDSGRHIWETLRQLIAWRFGALANCRALLDFASGYGRVTRHMVREMSPDTITVSDIEAAGVAFQERQFGVRGLRSAKSPRDFSAAERFDCITVSSLFTHLPPTTFTCWLERLGSLLRPDGLLLFSVHDMSLRRDGPSPADAGIVFARQSESGSLDVVDYGTAWVTESYVRQAVQAAIGPAAVLRLARGLANYHDLYVVLVGVPARPRSEDIFSTLKVRRRADGFMEHCSWVGNRVLSVRGWVADRTSAAPPKEVRILIDGLEAACCRELQPRAPNAQAFAADPILAVGWEAVVELPAAADLDTAQLRICPVSSAGEEMELFCDSILGAVLRSALVECAGLEARLSGQQP